jgi:hypothetical protein
MLASAVFSPMKIFLPIVLCLFAGCATSNSPSGPLAAKRLAGHWHQGDGLGYNVSLSLNKDSTYDAEFWGCVGSGGTARGNWRLVNDKVLLSPIEEKDLMVNHLRSLDVVNAKKGFVLVQSGQRRQFDTFPSDSSFGCFTRSN